MYRNWRDSRAGCALDLQRLEDQGEFVESPRGNFIQLHVFQQMNAVHNQHDLVNRTGELRIRIRRNPIAELSDPTSIGSWRASHSAAATPIPGALARKRALSFPKVCPSRCG